MTERPSGGWLGRLRRGLGRTADALGESIATVFVRRRLDADALDSLEEALIAADLGVGLAARVVERFGRTRFDQDVSADEVRATLAEEIAAILRPVAVPLVVEPVHRPHVMLVVGVNGSGKTTTIGKLANRFRGEGRTVVLAAGDTFRAAAVEQLRIWGERSGAPVVARETGADAAGVAFEALQRARADGADVLMVDTAGRLHNKADLMAELQKVSRVLRKLDPSAPHSVILVLDATTGQNAVSQVQVFRELCDVTGLVMTKLDGTARGGVLVAVAEKFGLPVHAIGVGEGVDDLRPFEAESFARALVGLDPVG
jgi:fused signal recognition particle receptor